MPMITLKAARVSAGLTQTQLAVKLGVTTSTICNWERGKTEPSFSDMKKISKITDIPMHLIFLPNEVSNNDI